MAAEFVFTSPGVKFRERNLTFVTRNVGITTLGLVGETLKGPAFEPIPIKDKAEFRDRFGGQSTKRWTHGVEKGELQYQLPYVANAYLEESNQLYVTRVLGLSGYDAGNAWALTLSAGIDPATIEMTEEGAPFEEIFTGSTYGGVTLMAVGDKGVRFTGFTKINDTDFIGISYLFTATTITKTGGTCQVIPYTLTGSSYAEYEGMVLAIIRSRGIVKDNTGAPANTEFEVYQNDTGLTISDNLTINDIGNLFSQFKLTATNRGLKNPPPVAPETPEDLYSGSTDIYTVSLNPNSSSFLPNVIGLEAKDKATKIWVEAIYPDLIKWLDAAGDECPSGLTKFGISRILPYGYGVTNTLLVCSGESFTNYRSQFLTPETPWVVSQLKGNSVDRLFKFISISDGDAANAEIKISIANIKPDTLEFDVIIRDFYDTDENPRILETFSRCTLIKGSTGFIGQRIGTSDGEYDLMSKYVMVEMADQNIAPEVFPAGFEGYLFTDFSDYGAKNPKIVYKTRYATSEKLRKTYLGISEKAYNIYDSDDTVDFAGTGINQNFFNFKGLSGYIRTKGFHMDSEAIETYNDFEFEVGEGRFQTYYDIDEPEDTYYELASRKFTLVPAGGFDGWDINRGYRSYGDNYRPRGIWDGVPAQEAEYKTLTDWQAWYTAIHTFDNPEEVTINLFATPGINWMGNTTLVQETIEMIETERTDSLYVIDTPNVGLPMIIGQAKNDVENAKDVVGMLDAAEIDSNYACTYFPWIQIRDTQNNVNVYIPPTGEVVKSMAFTDNVKFPWFAPAGIQRGVTDARKSKFKLSLDARDILYAGRINPVADFADVGTAIFGQKTLQKRKDALNRINVRRLLLQIKVLISNIAIRLLFEQNDQATIDQFLQKVTPILDNIKRERGLYEFRIKMDDSNNTPETRDRNELYGEIFLKPTRSLEYIGLTFTLTPSGASFADVGA